jgi:hypothetical protein
MNTGKIIDSTLKLCISASIQPQDWETIGTTSAPVTEGPSVIKYKGLYYMFYSGNNYSSPEYAVGYATATSPYGPWTKSANNPIISSTIVLENGSGHGDFFIANDGNPYYVYHVHNSNTTVLPRRTRIVPLHFNANNTTGVYDISVNSNEVIIPQMTSIAPYPPTNAVATVISRQASVAFDAPLNNGGSTILDYTVKSNVGNFTATGTASPILVNGLNNGTFYTFTVTARNSNGSSEDSAASNAITPIITTPSAPIITGITTGNNQLSVAFTARENGGSVITNYKYSIDGGATFATRQTGTTESPIVITGLTNGISYDVQIKAVNAIGDGAASETVVGSPPIKIYVNTSGSDAGTGTLSAPYKTFSKALKMVGTGTTEVYLAAGTYLETVPDTLNSTASTVTIRGENAKTTIIQQTTAGKRIFINGSAHRASNNSLTIQDVTFKNGTFTGGGGAAINYQETAGFKNNLTLERVVFEGNTVTTSNTTTQNGGALTFTGNNLTVNNCYFKNNKVISGAAATGSGLTSAGGAIYIVNTVPVGGVNHTGVFVNINNTTFEGNSAVSKGGAISVANINAKDATAANSYVKCTNCTFFNNKVTKNPTTTTETDIVTGSAFSAVTSSATSVMIYDFAFVNCTFSGNKGGSADGSTSVNESKAVIDIDGKQWETATFVNNIINSSSTANCGASLMANVATGGTKIMGSNNIIESVYTTYISEPAFYTSGANATNMDAVLTDNSTSTFFAVPYLKIGAASLAINFGINSFGTPNIIPTTDVRNVGNTDNKDAGAYEYDTVTSSIKANVEVSEMSIYPNPTSGLLHIKSENEIATIHIYDLLGNLVLSQVNQSMVNASQLVNGVYIMRAIDKRNVTRNFRFVKKIE